MKNQRDPEKKLIEIIIFGAGCILLNRNDFSRKGIYCTDD